MKDWRKTLINADTSIIKTVEIIDKGSVQVAIVVDKYLRLLGTVTDGDVRRGLLRGVSLDVAVKEIMNPNPTVAASSQSKESILALMQAKQLRQIPIVDDAGRIVGIDLLDDLVHIPKENNWVIIMAGGIGARLRPLTYDCPKPMLKVGGKPILETIIENFIIHGFRKIILSVNYKADIIEQYFCDGSKWGVEIYYLREQERLGTAGALSLLPQKPDLPFFVMNGDILTKVNFSFLLDFHLHNKAMATMCIRELTHQIPYGVVSIDNHYFKSIQEKPVHNYFVNAGVYLLEPSVFDFIEPRRKLDMPTLFNKMARNGNDVAVFPIREYWMDIGRVHDYEKANGDFHGVFG